MIDDWSFGGNEIPVFRPTWEEFKDFKEYIKKIEERGDHKFGIAKVNIMSKSDFNFRVGKRC